MFNYTSKTARLARARNWLLKTSSESWIEAVRQSTWTKYSYHTRVNRDELTEAVVMDDTDVDMVFLLHCRDDLAYLLDHSDWQPERVYEISERLAQSTQGEWVALLESHGGLGGCSVLQMGADDPPIEVEIYCHEVSDDFLEFIDDSRFLLHDFLDTGQNPAHT